MIIGLELVALGGWWYLRRAETSYPATEGENYFLLTDTAGINFIQLDTNIFERKNAQWLLNQRYLADRPLLGELFTLMGKIEIQQLITGQEGQALGKEIDAQGKVVEFRKGNQVATRFKVWRVRGNTYALSSKSQYPAAIYIPGYSIDLYEAFTLPEGEWRNKNLVSTGWLGVRKVHIRYSETPEQNVLLQRQGEFYTVEGVKQLDSATVYQFVDNFRNFRVYTFIDNPALRDSLQKLIPFCQMEIETLEGTIALQIYVNKKTGMFGITQPQGELVQLEPRYFSRFLMRRKDFEL